jgi:hypothetical protein
MNKYFYVLLVLFASCKKPVDITHTPKTNPDIIWSKNYGSAQGDMAEAIFKTIDGSLILAGTTGSEDFSIIPGRRSSNFLIMKVDQQGVTQWRKQFGGEAADNAYAIAGSNDGKFFVAGNTNSSSGQVTGYHAASNTQDAWVLKIGEDGNLLWQKALGGFKNDETKGVVATQDGGCIAVGFTNSTDGDLTGMKGGLWIVRLSAQGDIEWQKTYGDALAQSIVGTPDGNFLITGIAIDGSGEFSNNIFRGRDDVVVLKVNGEGNIIWSKFLGGSDMDHGKSVIVTKDGGTVICGYSSSMDGDVTGLHYNRRVGQNEDMWLVKLDPSGSLVWQKTLGGVYRDRGTSVIETTQGDLVAAGFRVTDVYAVRLSKSGATIWEKTFGGTGIDEGKGIVETNDGNFIFLGKSDSKDYDVKSNLGWYDYWFVKFKN